MISLKYITSLTFSQLCGAGGGCKKTPLYISLQAIIIGEKKNQTKLILLRFVIHECSQRDRACCCLCCYFPEWLYHYNILVSV